MGSQTVRECAREGTRKIPDCRAGSNCTRHTQRASNRLWLALASLAAVLYCALCAVCCVCVWLLVRCSHCNCHTKCASRCHQHNITAHTHISAGGKCGARAEAARAGLSRRDWRAATRVRNAARSAAQSAAQWGQAGEQLQWRARGYRNAMELATRI